MKPTLTMTPLELANRYVALFYSGDVEALRGILAEDLRFEGPFFRGDTADAYLEALRKDPPEEMEYEVLRSFEEASSACLIYRFTKPGIQTPMAQVFDVEGSKIRGILLVFDTGAFTKSEDQAG